MKLKGIVVSVASMAFLLSAGVASAASPLVASCVGVPATSSITWTASSTGGVAPVAFLWQNGSTTPVQTTPVSPGTYSMTLQATDASSTVATTTCSATVAVQSAPTITSFVATPSSITSGQSTVLSWVVANASSTSLDNSIGLVTTTSVTVSPTVTTTYSLSATNPQGTTIASVTVTVNGNTALQQQIQNIQNQIAALQAQLKLLLQQQGNGGGVSSTTCPTFSRDLYEGENGDDVRVLQQTLSAANPSILPPGLVTGYFGPRTREAVRQFQQKFGIASTSTGYFGSKSRGYLGMHCGWNDNNHGTSSSTPPSISGAIFNQGNGVLGNRGNGNGEGRGGNSRNN